MSKFLQKAVKVAVSVAMLAAPFGTNAGTNDVFKGWSWSSNIGWVSVNNINQNTSLYSYGVTIDSSRNLTGYAWSPNIGWICFGSTCSGTAPDGAASWALLGSDEYTPQVYGWARALSFSTGNNGWISFNCQSDGVHPARNVCGTSNYKVWTTLNSPAPPPPNYDGQFQGYAWNCAGITSGTCTPANYETGFGWLHFSPVYTPVNLPEGGTYGGVPWIQVLYGNLYSKGSISTPSPFTTTFAQVNATYCIDSSLGAAGITNFTNVSANCASGTLSPSVSLPKKATNYSNVLGRFKLRGYSIDTTNGLHPINNSTTNLAAQKYGPWVSVSSFNGLPSVLGGAVYDSFPTTGNWTMGGTTFNNAPSGGNGSGLLIVRGNLEITGNILYGSGSISSLNQLASLGILVLDDGAGHPGNITIDPSVTTIDANIYAEGEVSTGTTGSPLTESPLQINGVVVAKQFNFQRNYQGGVNQPSEQIVNDGRIVVNTPPGMNDFIASLPVVSY
jgi:hypothetical protein